MNKLELWQRYRKYLGVYPEIGMMLDLSRMNFPDDFFQLMEPLMQQALEQMAELERGGIANGDEKRMVGHYWLRNPELAPTKEISSEIGFTLRAIKEFTENIHSGAISPPNGSRYTRMLIIGIGGSALGPQFVADALGSAKDKITPFFFDNTDPDGMDLVLARIGSYLKETLTIVISKSGGTKETRNGMLEAKKAYEDRGLLFARQAVAVTGRDSELDRTAAAEGWLARFPMWDWIGGRTSVTSAVGLLPAALQGLDIDGLLEGARLCDMVTRIRETRNNPAALLALMWHYATGGCGAKDMVILPYKDRLLLFSRYLQQLIMESIGKEFDRNGTQANQGIAVYGNKGSTDQHAYVQQLREGINNFFVTFIEVLKDRNGRSIEVDPGVTSGDYLSGFFQGTREALYEKGRESITITVDELSPRTIGVLIALYERAVGFYASLVNINAYHQPGVEAGKKAAGVVLEIQGKVLAHLQEKKGRGFTAEELAAAIGAEGEAEAIYRILLHAAANPDHSVVAEKGRTVFDKKFYHGG
ncbi:glucose-6-phosphate isomerase [Geotalea daltonii FRC-32]|uniref:Glucose-6-phosphate isomerase n=1 Tax=Geotalea daltonii (strain DSM 22248 / JCM 15807 / FRC-32) TaxID=316067 RepID=G6PI_GEODF|nr:glucose-6-phosphate isomerase [Geotalea daltonii]B9M5A2.1 RecName: Full=Glucose-6-phosphate isomerase; Short=GPI; AltName: Full=Phosphoglucose isomerase; Short=PGI; AltName: Full=Phosphohexose isomerase; Short=PHI [Geotalea daltonii FRC-32]ACM19857.1 glucose-6-phosphate isomerase [Geotalea daltonii FRC-32]